MKNLRAVHARPIVTALALLLVAVSAADTARTQPAGPPAAARPGEAVETENRRANRSAHARLLPVAAALFPGVLVHGSGHFAAGRRGVARRLLTMEGIGLGLVAAGGAPLLLTGASRQVSGPSIALLVSGIGLFGQSWLADIYGTAAGGGPSASLPEGRTGGGAPIEIEAGYGHVYDPHFAYRQFAVASATAWLGAFRLAPSAWIALDSENQRLRQEVGWRLAGAGSGRPSGDGSSVELIGALTYHRYADDRFAVTTGEASIAGRLDMSRLGNSLAGSFSELSLGLGTEVTNYYAPGAGADLGELLLVRFAYGTVVGRPGGFHGEVSLYYDHRRDTFAGGLSPGTGPGSGFVGLFGTELIVHLGQRWGMRAEFEQGAARVFHVGLTVRLGRSP